MILSMNILPTWKLCSGIFKPILNQISTIEGSNPIILKSINNLIVGFIVYFFWYVNSTLLLSGSVCTIKVVNEIFSSFKVLLELGKKFLTNSSLSFFTKSYSEIPNYFTGFWEIIWKSLYGGFNSSLLLSRTFTIANTLDVELYNTVLNDIENQYNYIDSIKPIMRTIEQKELYINLKNEYELLKKLFVIVEIDGRPHLQIKNKEILKSLEEFNNVRNINPDDLSSFLYNIYNDNIFPIVSEFMPESQVITPTMSLLTRSQLLSIPSLTNIVEFFSLNPITIQNSDLIKNSIFNWYKNTKETLTILDAQDGLLILSSSDFQIYLVEIAENLQRTLLNIITHVNTFKIEVSSSLNVALTGRFYQPESLRQLGYFRNSTIDYYTNLTEYMNEPTLLSYPNVLIPNSYNYSVYVGYSFIVNYMLYSILIFITLMAGRKLYKMLKNDDSSLNKLIKYIRNKIFKYVSTIDPKNAMNVYNQMHPDTEQMYSSSSSSSAQPIANSDTLSYFIANQSKISQASLNEEIDLNLIGKSIHEEKNQINGLESLKESYSNEDEELMYQSSTLPTFTSRFSTRRSKEEIEKQALEYEEQMKKLIKKR
jgi:hypothetical protein